MNTHGEWVLVANYGSDAVHTANRDRNKELTDDEVRSIRAMLQDDGGFTQPLKDIANDFGIDTWRVQAIMQRRTDSQVPDAAPIEDEEEE